MIFDPNRMVDPRILIWIFMVMIYGFLEIGLSLDRRWLEAQLLERKFATLPFMR